MWGVEAVDGLGGNDAQPETAPQGDDLLGQRPARRGHQIGADRQTTAFAEDAAKLGHVARRRGAVAGAQEALQPAGAPAGQADQPAGMGAQFGQRQAGAAAALAVGAGLKQRGQAAERAIAGRIGSQQHETARPGMGVGRQIVGRQGHGGGQADDGPDAGGAAGAGEADRAEEGVAVGQSQLAQAVAPGAGNEVVEQRRRPQQRVMRMQVQVGKIGRQRAHHSRDDRSESGDWQATFSPFGEER